MANRTDSTATSVHGTNPQYLVEKIVRLKIHESSYWKEHCYALTAETLVDKAVDLEYIGGTYGGHRKPAPFLCLALKMLQLQPELEIVYEFIKNKDYKYVSALGCFYLRLIGRPEDVYIYLEPLYNDYRKLRYRETDGKYKLIHVDEFVEDLLHKDATCDTVLPRIPKRQILEDADKLKIRHSVLEDVDEDDEALLAEIRGDGVDEPLAGLAAGEEEFVENPRARALKGESEEKSKSGDEVRKSDDEERRKKKEKKKHKKEKKKSKYRTRGSISRSNSRHKDDEERGDSEGRSRSRSRSRSHKKKKKSSKWKKNLKDKRKGNRSRSRSRSDSSRSRSRSGDRGKDKKDNGKQNGKGEEKKDNGKVDENSDEYWLNMRAKLGLKPM